MFPPLLDCFCFYYVFTVSVLYCAHYWMKCSLDISNFLEEIFSLSPSVLVLYLVALFIKEGSLSLLAILWNAVLSWVDLPLSPLLFT